VRVRFYLLDRVTELQIGEVIRGIKAWTLTDEIFEQHFPHYPVVPGVLQIESMAQLMGLYFEQALEAREKAQYAAIFTIVHKAKFKDFVRPGDQVLIEGRPDHFDNHTGIGKIKSEVNGKVVSECELQFRFFKNSPDSEFTKAWEEHHQKYHKYLLSGLKQNSNHP
jgi:3-hydroxyacyl-[acyl-carrier-protein] dehydratase